MEKTLKMNKIYFYELPRETDRPFYQKQFQFICVSLFQLHRRQITGFFHVIASANNECHC